MDSDTAWAGFRHALALSAPPLDSAQQPPRLWAAALGGIGLGLAWGVLARLWMRLISTEPGFTLPGTVAILVITSLFGGWTGLALAARRRGWRGWRHYLPRCLAVLFFLPFGIAGGLPLMLTVLVAALGLFQQALVGLWAVAALVALAALGTDIELPGLVSVGASALAAALAAWKLIARRWRALPGVARADAAVERAVRGALLLIALGGVGLVARDILASRPGLLGIAYVGCYVILLVPLILALRVGLGQRAPIPG